MLWGIALPLFLLLLLTDVCKGGEGGNVTVVTGFWRVSSKHDLAKYERWFRNTLRIKAPYVVFYEGEDVREMITTLRLGLPTAFVERPMSSFKVASVYPDRPSAINHLHVPTREVALIWNEKAHLVAEAAVSNRFDTAWFAWVDAGIAAFRAEAPPPTPWPAADISSLCRNCVVYSRSGFADRPPAHRREGVHDFAGTAFAYHGSFAAEVERLYYEELNLCLANTTASAMEWRCGSDQIVFSRLKTRRPELFNKIAVGFGAVVSRLYEPTPLPPRCGEERFKEAWC